MRRRVNCVVAAVALLAVLLGLNGAPAAAQDPEAPAIYEVLGTDDPPRFTLLFSALDIAGVRDMFDSCEGDGQYTVFAPTDTAFEMALAELGLETVDVVGDPELLLSVLTYHVVPGAAIASDAATSTSVTMASGEDAEIVVSEGSISIKSGNPAAAVVIDADIAACNGIIHVIDNVLVPPSVAAALGLPAAEEPEAAEEQDETEELAATGTTSDVLAIIAATTLAAGLLLARAARRLRYLR